MLKINFQRNIGVIININDVLDVVLGCFLYHKMKQGKEKEENLTIVRNIHVL